MAQGRVAELEGELAKAREMIDSGSTVAQMLGEDVEALRASEGELRKEVGERDERIGRLVEERIKAEGKLSTEVLELQEE